MQYAAKIIWIYLLGCFWSQVVLAQNQALIDSLVQVLETDISTEEQVDLYVRIAEEFKDVDSSNTVKYANQAIQLAEEIQYPEGRVNALAAIAWATMEVGYYDQAEELFEQVIQESKLLNFKSGEAKGLRGLGSLREYQGNYAKAIAYYFQSLQINQALGKKQNIADDFNNIGVALYYQGNYAKAIEYYFQTLKIKEQLGDKKGMASAYNNIGIIYDIQGNYENALKYYLKSLQITQELGNKNGIAKNYNNIGLVYSDRGEYEKALEYYFQSLEIKEEIGDKRGIATSYHSIASIYFEQKNYTDALTYALKDLNLLEEIGSRDYKASSLILIGNIYQSQGQNQLAQKHLSEALELAKKSGNTKNIRDAALTLSTVEKDLGNYQKAFETHALFKQMADSLQNEELTIRITRLEAEYEFKQEKDSIQFANQAERIVLEKDIKYRKNLQLATFIALGLFIALALILFWFFQSKNYSNKLLTEKTKELKSANEEILAQKQEITQQNTQLQDLNKMKDRVFSIVAHDLRSPIQSLQSLLMLFQSDYEITQEKMRQWIERLSENVEGVSGLLKNLLYWAQSQMQGDLTLSPVPLALKPFVQEAVQLHTEYALSKGIQTEVEIEENLPDLLVDPEILRFLLRNILNNAYKFSHEGGQVSVEASLKSDKLVKVLVKDNGVGMDEKRKHELFKGLVRSQMGTSEEKGSGLGLMLCQEFVEQSGGSIGVESQLGQGSTFWFTLAQALKEDQGQE